MERSNTRALRYQVVVMVVGRAVQKWTGKEGGRWLDAGPARRFVAGRTDLTSVMRTAWSAQAFLCLVWRRGLGFAVTRPLGANVDNGCALSSGQAVTAGGQAVRCRRWLWAEFERDGRPSMRRSGCTSQTYLRTPCAKPPARCWLSAPRWPRWAMHERETGDKYIAHKQERVL